MQLSDKIRIGENLLSKTNGFWLFLSILVLVLVILAGFPLVGLAASSLYILPSSADIEVADSLLLEIRINTDKVVNVAEASLEFDDTSLEFQDFFTGGSVIDVWAQTPRLESPGAVSFIGGMPQGFSGDGLIGKIVFTSKQTGQTQVRFTEDSQVFLHSPNAVPDSLALLEGTYRVEQELGKQIVISSGNCPDEGKWCPWENLDLFWEVEPGVSYSYILSTDSNERPDDISEDAVGEIRYEGLTDGIYYFSLKELSGGEDGATARYRAMIDTISPEAFDVEILLIEGDGYLVFATQDGMSGIDRYELWIKEALLRESIISPYLVSNDLRGKEVQIVARDKAGNERRAEVQIPRIYGFKNIFWSILALGIVGILVFFAKKVIFKKRYKT